MSYIGTAPSKTTPNYKIVSEFTATAGQTVFAPSAYTVGFLDVFRNGVKLGAPDFTATNGTTVTLANACTAGDFVRFESGYLSPTQNAIPNTAGAVSTSLLADASVTQAKLGTNVAGNGPAFSAYLAINQSVTTSTWTKIALGTERFDTANAFDKDTNYRFQPLIAGYYQINGTVTLNNNASGAGAYSAIYKNGSVYATTGGLSSVQVYGSMVMNQIIYLNGSTDYIELYVYPATGSGYSAIGTIFATGDGTQMSGTLVRAA